MDEHRELGIYDPNNDLHISMFMPGSFCSFNTRCPTYEELDTCRYVILSDEHSWNPDSATFNVSALSGEIFNYQPPFDY